MNRNSRCCPRWYQTQTLSKAKGSSGSGSVHFSGGRSRPPVRPWFSRSGARAPGAHAAPLARSQGLAYLGVKLSVAPARAQPAALLLWLLCSTALVTLRSVIVDRSIDRSVCSCVVGAGRENLQWNFYTPRSFDGPHRSIFDRDRILSFCAYSTRYLHRPRPKTKTKTKKQKNKKTIP